MAAVDSKFVKGGEVGYSNNKESTGAKAPDSQKEKDVKVVLNILPNENIGEGFKGTSAMHWHFTSFEINKRVIGHNSNIKYIIYQLEECPSTKRQHWQGYVQLIRARTRKWVKEQIGLEGHYTIEKGDPVNSIAYCSKLSSRVIGTEPIVIGTPKSQGKRNDINELEEIMLKGGKEAVLEKYGMYYVNNLKHTLGDIEKKVILKDYNNKITVFLKKEYHEDIKNCKIFYDGIYKSNNKFRFFLRLNKGSEIVDKILEGIPNEDFFQIDGDFGEKNKYDGYNGQKFFIVNCKDSDKNRYSSIINNNRPCLLNQKFGGRWFNSDVLIEIIEPREGL